jgi:hypothetical protein
MLHCTYSYISCLVTTVCMGQNSSWGAASGLSCHGIPRLLWKPKPHYRINPLNAELNPMCHLLALLGAQHILHISRIRVNKRCKLSLLWTTPTQSKSSHPVSLRSVSIRSVYHLVDLPSDGFWEWEITKMVKQLGPFYPGYCPVACSIKFVLTTKLLANVR